MAGVATSRRKRCRHAGRRNDDGRATTDEVGCRFGQLLIVDYRSVFDGDVPAFDITSLCQPFLKGRHTRSGRILPDIDQADHRHSRRLDIGRSNHLAPLIGEIDDVVAQLPR